MPQRVDVRQPSGAAGPPTLVGVLIPVAIWAASLLFWSSGLDPYATFKMTAVALCAVALAFVAALDVSTRRRLELKGGPTLVALGAFLVVGLLTTLVSTNTWRSFIGQRGRATGFSTYLVLGLVFLVLAACGRLPDVRRIATSVGLAGFAVNVYGLAQRLGLDPLHQHSALYGGRAPIATLGNANFVSAVGAIALPLLTWRALEAGRTRLGLLYGGAALLTVLGVLNTRSVQGVLAGSVGMAVVFVGAVLPRAAPGLRRRLVAAGALLTFVIVLLIGAGLAGRGPVSSQLNDVGRTQRLEFWHAAASMIADHPVLGVGFDEFGSHYRAYRSQKAALEFGILDTADEPHNVPLGMAVGGGVVLGLAYVAFVVAVGFTLVRGVRRTTGTERALLLGLGGAWVAYQLQSFVSIDNPPLSLLHFALAGSIVVMASPARVLWADDRRVRRGRGPRQAPAPKPSSVALTMVGALCLVAAWFVLLPARAELAAAAALNHAKAGNGDAAVHAMQDAHDLLPREPMYLAETGRFYGQGGQDELAVSSYGEAARREPDRLSIVLPYARLLVRTGDLASAETWYRRALSLERASPELKLEVAKFELSKSDWQSALRLLRPALALRPDDASLNLAAGDANALGRRYDEADRHYDLGLKESPLDHDLRLRLAATELRRQRQARAAAVLEECTRTFPTSEECWYQLGEARLMIPDLTGARTAFERALTFAPPDQRAFAAIVRMQAAPGKIGG